MTDLIDVFKKALADEVKAAVFYKLAAETTEDDQARMVFLDLVGMEENHAKELISKVEGTSLLEGWNAEAYLRELESTTSITIFEDIAPIVRRGDTKTILELARNMEVKARQNYETLATESKEKSLRDFFSDMVNEENSHIKQMDFLLLSLDIDEQDKPGL
jgi:rubrerythrin